MDKWTETIKVFIHRQYFLHKCIMANTSALWQQAAHTTDYHPLAAQKTADKKKVCFLTKNIGNIFW